MYKYLQFSSVQSLSRVRLCDSMNRSTPGLPVHHRLPEFTQTHVHWVSDSIQPSHPLSSPSPPAPNPSQHQSIFQWVNSSHEDRNSFHYPLITFSIPFIRLSSICQHCWSLDSFQNAACFHDSLHGDLSVHAPLFIWNTFISLFNHFPCLPSAIILLHFMT